MQPKRHGSSSNSQGGWTHNLIPDLNEEPPASEDQFENLSRQIPKVFHPYISNTSLQDVEPDGNCGFRSVALGLGLTEDDWPIIRSDLVLHLESNQEKYRWIFGTRGDVQMDMSLCLCAVATYCILVDKKDRKITNIDLNIELEN
ncbi:hypothetical protein CTI12_AA335860 [Artemisia annua]|uniref:OTU domain-containing protein n=1 Tax=Artemisia annua TaxID=35608 RepID=A0A2U1MV46_ARTAN|nr:hypothetical protein CTI12_AA335860 [Artemisia annua]